MGRKIWSIGRLFFGLDTIFCGVDVGIGIGIGTEIYSLQLPAIVDGDGDVIPTAILCGPHIK